VKSYYRPALFLLLISISNAVYSDPFKIAFGSCLDQDLPQPIWSTIQKDEVNAFIFLGDNVYGDDNSSGELNILQKAYSKQKLKLPSWLSEKDIYSIWDDHDYGENDGGNSYKGKKESQELFLNFWGIPNDDQRYTQEGIYFDHEFIADGVRVHLIGLDTRYFRSELDGGFRSYKVNDNDQATILGTNQWSWLNKTIKKDADLIILMTSIQLLATNHAYEKWSLFPSERKKMLKLIDGLDTTTIILSGDRHRAGIYKYNNIYEITASALNKPSSRKSSKETDPLLLHEMYVKENYGLMLIDGGSRKVKFSLKDIEGNIINTKTIEIK
jgi:alkaline phosphatase D